MLSPKLSLAYQGTKCYNVAQPQNSLKKEATMKSALKKVYKSLMHAYFGRDSLTKDILDFRGVGFLPRQKLKLLKRYKAPSARHRFTALYQAMCQGARSAHNVAA